MENTINIKLEMERRERTLGRMIRGHLHENSDLDYFNSLGKLMKEILDEGYGDFTIGHVIETYNNIRGQN